jgi:hypothetical protein
MTGAQAKKQLHLMLLSLTPGSVLYLLSELFAKSARCAGRRGDKTFQKQAQEVAATLFVVGLGVDAVCPR